MQEANEKRGYYSVGIFLNCTTEKKYHRLVKRQKRGRYIVF